MSQLFFISSVASISVTTLVTAWVKDLYEYDQLYSGIPNDPNRQYRYVHVDFGAKWFRKSVPFLSIAVIIYFVVTAGYVILDQYLQSSPNSPAPSTTTSAPPPGSSNDSLNLFVQVASFLLVLFATIVSWWACKIRQITAREKIQCST